MSRPNPRTAARPIRWAAKPASAQQHILADKRARPAVAAGRWYLQMLCGNEMLTPWGGKVRLSLTAHEGVGVCERCTAAARKAGAL